VLERFGSSVDLARIGGKSFNPDGFCQIDFRRDHHGVSQKPVQAFDFRGLGGYRQKDRHWNTALGDDNSLQFSAADPIEYIEALRFELARSNRSTVRHHRLLVIADDQYLGRASSFKVSVE
jgi:hypothetical protein